MKKILIMGMSSILGGVETYIYNLIKYIDKENLLIDFLVVGEKSVFEDEINSIFDDGRNHFYYVPNMKKYYIRTNKMLKSFFRNHRYDLIYLNTVTAARTRYCRYAIDKQRTALVVHSHSSKGVFFRNINNNLYRNYVNKHSCLKLVCSDLAGEKVFGKGQEDILVIPNGIDTSRFVFSSSWRNEIRQRYNIDDNKIVVGHVGRFSKEKNHKFFINLCERLNDNYIFMCIGDGETKQDFCDMIEERGLSHRFIVLSTKSDVEKYYSAMDIFAMPSLFEGLPIVAVEAQGTGLPCILSSDISRQTALSDRCVFASIEDVDGWIEAISDMNLSRYDGYKVINENCYDVYATAKLVRKLFDDILI